jgi:hypothetical protein
MCIENSLLVLRRWGILERPIHRTHHTVMGFDSKIYVDVIRPTIFRIESQHMHSLIRLL